MEFINRLPICELVYMFSIGMTFQLRVLYPHLTNLFVHRMMSGKLIVKILAIKIHEKNTFIVGSGGRSDRVAENYAGIMMGLQ